MQYAPGEQMHLEGFREIPTAKFPTIKRVNGRVAIFNGRERVGGQTLLFNRIGEMKAEVKAAEQGARGVAHTESGSRAYAKQSSFPKWYSGLGVQNKEDFLKAVRTKQGVKFERIAEHAAKDLNSGYETPYGDVDPSTEWKVKTKQVYDNRGVVFRRVRGRIIPIRTKQVKSYPDEVPF